MNLTQEEYRQLEAIKVLYPWVKWLARNKNGKLVGYSVKPKRISHEEFDSELGYCIEMSFCLHFITWESEPLNIDESLKNRSESE